MLTLVSVMGASSLAAAAVEGATGGFAAGACGAGALAGGIAGALSRAGAAGAAAIAGWLSAGASSAPRMGTSKCWGICKYRACACANADQYGPPTFTTATAGRYEPCYTHMPCSRLPCVLLCSAMHNQDCKMVSVSGSMAGNYPR